MIPREITRITQKEMLLAEKLMNKVVEEKESCMEVVTLQHGDGEHI